MEDGGVVVYWREGCPFCKRLDKSLGELGDKALWVNVWEDSAGSDFIKSVNDGNEIVPTVAVSRETFVAAGDDTRSKAATLIEESSK
ncbi:NrdH-redoxin [Rothia sp. ZJ932]|nr:NrdH-redoxin [Rothia sp. ZJ1223]QRZ62483.1 NrdH-redoxin [Rothia sp. ZJ932]